MHNTAKSGKNIRFDFFLIFFSILIILLVFLYTRKNNSAVLPLPVVISPTATIKHFEKAKVASVIDGDTIILDNNKKVRFIGIDAPEKYYDGKKDDCFAVEAKDVFQQLLENQVVELEKDVSETDKFGRLLRYVYLDGEFVNEFLVRQGFAKALIIPPDTKYKDLIINAENSAQNQRLGLWKKCEDSPT